MREKPRSSITSSTARSGWSISTATMSGRGTITSRTTVSPKVKMEWISSRSCGSMLPSSCPTSAIVRMSPSETNGPCLSPFPGSSTFASPMSARVGRLSTRPRKYTTGASASATRSLCRMPNVFAMASTTTK